MTTSAQPAPAHHGFGPVFKKMRTAREITRTHLAKKLGLTPTYIRQVENGRQRPSRATIAKLTEGLGISPIVALAVFRAVGDDLRGPLSNTARASGCERPAQHAAAHRVLAGASRL